MTGIDRRRFLIQGGSSLAGIVIASAVPNRWLAAADAMVRERRASSNVGLETLGDDLASVVTDLEKKFPYASALFAAQSGINASRDRNGKRVSESGFPSRGTSLTVFDGAEFHSAAIGSASIDDLRAAAKRLTTEVPVAKARYHIEPLAPHTETWTAKMVEDPAKVTLADRVARVEREFERCNWNDPRVRSVRVATEVGEVRRVFVDRTRRLTSTTVTVAHNVLMFGFDQGKPGFGFARRVGQGGLELASLSDEALERMKREFVESFGAGQVPAGEYEVVFAPAVSGLLAHESFGHGVEMDQFVKDRAKAREFLGKPVASRIVNLMDDPSVPGQRGSYPFDDEGMLAQPTQIIAAGVFVQPLTDLMSATLLSTRRTPNGRTQGWDRKVYARMSNTFFANGTSEKGELMESLKDGLYLEGFRNGIEDPQGWGIQFTASVAREVKNGKLTGKIYSPATVTGYVPDILSNITLVANDLDFEPGTCGKGFKEFVPVSSGGPHLRTKARVS